MRKLNTAVGLMVPAFSLVVAGYVGCDWVTAFVFFCLSVGLNSLTGMCKLLFIILKNEKQDLKTKLNYDMNVLQNTN